MRKMEKLPQKIATLGIIFVFSLAFAKGQDPCPKEIDNEAIEAWTKENIHADSLVKWQQSNSTVDLQNLLVKQHSPNCTLHDTLRALIGHKVGLSFQNQVRDYRSAIFHYKKALHLRHLHLDSLHEDIIKGYNNIGSCFRILAEKGEDGLLDSAMYMLEISYRLNMRRDRPTSTIRNTYFHLSRVSELMGDVDNALFYLEAALQHYQNGKKQPKNLAITHNALANLYIHGFQEASQALFHEKEALKYFEDTGVNSWRDTLTYSDWLGTTGAAYMLLGSMDSALLLLHSARVLSEKVIKSKNWPDDHPYQIHCQGRIAKIYNNIGIRHNRNRSYQKGIESLHQAMRINQEIASKTGLASNYDNLGDAYLGLGQLDQALDYYSKAENLSDASVTERGNFLNSKRYLFFSGSKAKAFLRQYQQSRTNLAILDSAFHRYQELDIRIQSIRKSYETEGSKEAWVKLTKPIYEGAIETCLELYHATGKEQFQYIAFTYAEKSKSIILLDALHYSDAVRRGLPMEAQNYLKWLRVKRTNFEILIQNPIIRTKEIAYRDSIIRYRKLETDFLSAVQEKYPKYYALRYSPYSLELKEIKQNLLAPDQGLIEYFVGAHNLYIFFITPNQFQTHKIPKTFPLDSMVFALRSSISNKELFTNKDSSAKVLHDNASQLYNHLIRPLGPLDKLPPRLMIVRDHTLNLIPFEVLVSQKSKTPSQFLKFEYLIRDKAISYAFSAALQEIFRENHVQPQKRFIAFAPLEFDLVQNNQLLNPLSALRRTEEEVEVVSNKGDSEVYLMDEAKRNTFRIEAEKYWIVYVASHGIISHNNPRYNGIVFHDSVLYTADLYNLVLHAELVVLRACETGRTELQPGEGIASMAHGFASTGAKSIFSTQWKVTNASHFMEKFMEGIYKGKPKDVALQETQKNQLRGRHPYFWAAYEIQGDVSPAHFQLSLFSQLKLIDWAIILFGFFAFLFVAIWYRKNHDQQFLKGRTK